MSRELFCGRYKAVDDSKHPERVKLAPYRRQKRLARLLLWDAIRTRRIQKQPCEVCGSKRVEAHHTDYAKPLEVVWLCKEHHDRHTFMPGVRHGTES